MSTHQMPLHFNIGFIANQSIGYSREFSVNVPRIADTGDHEFRNLEATITVSRTTEGLLVQFRGEAHTTARCVRCLNDFEQPLHLDFVEMYTFRSHADETTELILPEDLNLNLHPLVREYLYLELPIAPVCKADCQGLCPVCGANLNETLCSHDDEIGDPRLAVLKTLLKDE